MIILIPPSIINSAAFPATIELGRPLITVSNASKRPAPLNQTSGRNMPIAHVNANLAKGTTVPTPCLMVGGTHFLAYQRLSFPLACHILIILHFLSFCKGEWQKLFDLRNQLRRQPLNNPGRFHTHINDPCNRRDEITRVLEPTVWVIDDATVLVLFDFVSVNKPFQWRSTVDDIAMCFCGYTG